MRGASASRSASNRTPSPDPLSGIEDLNGPAYGLSFERPMPSTVCGPGQARSSSLAPGPASDEDGTVEGEFREVGDDEKKN